RRGVGGVPPRRLADDSETETHQGQELVPTNFNRPQRSRIDMFTRYMLLGLTGFVLAVSSAPAQSNKDLLKSSPELLATLSEVSIKPSYSTVRIKSDGKEVALGTIVKPDGWILTKASELKYTPVTCVIKGSEKELPAKVVGVNKAFDL